MSTVVSTARRTPMQKPAFLASTTFICSPFPEKEILRIFPPHARQQQID
jgi:hypothetical protein